MRRSPPKIVWKSRRAPAADGAHTSIGCSAIVIACESHHVGALGGVEEETVAADAPQAVQCTAGSRIVQCQQVRAASGRVCE